jgi:glyoxylase-like metal-dependent hydrolase (beta-lactamase superfamily II)
MQITPRVHLIRDSFVNLYLIVDEDGLTLIDAGFGRNGGKVLRAITELGYAPQDLKRILITHCDGDHVGGVKALKARTGARAYASPVEAAAMAAGQPSREMRQDTLGGRLFNVVGFLFAFIPARADEMLSDEMVLSVSGGLRVISTPGHTPGHMSFYAPAEGILFSGDSIITQGGKLHISSGANTWDEMKAVESARVQAALGATIICSGHGPVIRDAANQFALLDQTVRA